MPLLVVRDRVYHPCQPVVVATDFALRSRAAVETAATWFAPAHLSLFHAFDVPFSSYLSSRENNRQLDTFGNDAADNLLAEADLHCIELGSTKRLNGHGSPEALLRDYAESSIRHVVVVDHGGGIVYEALIGSTALRIIDAVPGDVLLVPAPARRREPEGAG